MARSLSTLAGQQAGLSKSQAKDGGQSPWASWRNSFRASAVRPISRGSLGSPLLGAGFTATVSESQATR
jgi:hypothetical protein